MLHQKKRRNPDLAGGQVAAWWREAQNTHVAVISQSFMFFLNFTLGLKYKLICPHINYCITNFTKVTIKINF
jgi:hypothetical protein